jgi:hypothetical protein
MIRDSLGTYAPGPSDATNALRTVALSYTFTAEPSRFESICGPDLSDCASRASLVWQATQDHAEEHYDRTAACRFTTFLGYEWTQNTYLSNLHRNVIFRNSVVPPLPISYLDEETVEGLWAALESECLTGLVGCDVLTIPHNSNLSRGYIFAPVNGALPPAFPGFPEPPPSTPLTAADAAFRAAMEPVVELTQHKGDSECLPGLLTSDELCGYEKMNRIDLGAQFDPVTLPTYPFGPLAFVRNALKEGLLQEEILGVNPLQLGVIGSTDGHNATPGATREDDYTQLGHLGTADATPETQLSRLPLGGIEANPGGLAVVWAEENSRDALFEAMRRREVYATSGNRPIVRLFAGDLPKNLCARADLVEEGYTHGIPMGAETGPLRSNGSPRFAVLALKDPGVPGSPGAPLQRIQMIKGWIDGNGDAQEKVFEIAGDPDNDASVDPATCQTAGPGFDSLCTVWEDPQFDRSQRAFYYARILENPTCRWSTYLCNDLGVDCDDPSSVPQDFETCCDPQFPKIIQERAWTSPIFYRPEGIGHLKAKVKFGSRPGTDTLRLSATIGAVPSEFDLNNEDLTVTVSDNDEIYAATIPSGTMQEKTQGRKFIFKDKSGSLDGLKTVLFKVNGRGEGKLILKTIPLDLSNADQSDHMVNVKIQIGTYTASHTRLWQARGNQVESR